MGSGYAVVDNYLSATEAFDKGNYDKALSILLEGFEIDNSYRPLYELAERCFEEMNRMMSKELFRHASNGFNNPQVFFELGCYYTNVSNYRMSIPFLKRAYKLDSQDLYITLELSIALNAQFRVKESYEILRDLNEKDEFWVLYQFYWTALLCGKPQGIAEFIEGCRNNINILEDENSGELKEVTFVLDRLKECFARYKIVEIVKNKYIYPIQKWHFIQYGAVILEYFEQKEVAGGRYLIKWGEYSQVFSILSKLIYFIKKIEMQPILLISLEDRNSEILTRVLSKMLYIDYEIINEKNLLIPNTLVVSSDASELKNYDKLNLNILRKNQLLFSFNTNWLEEINVTPDISGVISQIYKFPWDSEVDVNISEYEIEKEILTQDEDAYEEDDFVKICSFYSELKDYLKGQKYGGLLRLNFCLDSPVYAKYL